MKKTIYLITLITLFSCGGKKQTKEVKATNDSSQKELYIELLSLEKEARNIAESEFPYEVTMLKKGSRFTFQKETPVAQDYKSSDLSQLYKIPSGYEVEVIDMVNEGDSKWYKIRFEEGQEGYVKQTALIGQELGNRDELMEKSQERFYELNDKLKMDFMKRNNLTQKDLDKLVMDGAINGWK